MSRAALALIVSLAFIAPLALAPSALAQEAPPYRILDAAAPFFNPRRPPPRSWAMPFSHLDLLEAPYVDEDNLAQSLRRFEAYCENAADKGYNALIIGNLIHIADFDAVADQGYEPVYPTDSPRRARASIYKRAFKQAAAVARERGLRLVIETDFPAWTPELKAWLGPAGLSLDNERLWVAYRAAIEECLREVGAEAISIRIGEGGGAYNEDTGYQSSVLIQTIADTQKTIAGLLAIVEEYNASEGAEARLLFRTWTIGIGEIGALHTRPSLYKEVFAPFQESSALITVMKHVAMDFFEYVPLNRTIGIGAIPQIVEFQARREYELFNIFPNARFESFKRTIARFRKAENFAGISVWPTNGGFLYPAPVAYRNDNGRDEWIDANVFAYGRLVRDPSLSPRDLAVEWLQSQGLERGDAALLARPLLDSAELVRRGLYIRPYAENAPALFGLDHMPTMLWIYWNRPVAALGTQALIYREARRDLLAAFEDGLWAVAEARRLRRAADAIAPGAFRQRWRESFDYAISCFELLEAYRRVFLNHHQWAESGDPRAFRAWRSAVPELEAACDEHERRYAGDAAFPPLSMGELRREIRDARRLGLARPAAAALAVAAGLLGLLILVPKRLSPAWLRASVTRPIGFFLASIVVLPAGAAAALCFDRPLWVAGLTAAAILLGLLSAGLAAAIAAEDGERRRASRRFPIPYLMPPLLIAAPGLAVFSWRGPVAFHAAFTELLFPDGPRALALILALIALALALLAPLIAARRAGLGRQRAVLALALQALIFAGFLGLAGRLAWPRGLVAANESLRVAPTIIGEAGTGVEELAAVAGE